MWRILPVDLRLQLYVLIYRSKTDPSMKLHHFELWFCVTFCQSIYICTSCDAYLDIIVRSLDTIPRVLAQVCQPQVCHLPPGPRAHQPEHVPVARHDGRDAIGGHAPTEGGPQHVTGGRVEADTVVRVGLLC